MQDRFPALGDLKTGNNAAWDVAFSHLWPVALKVARTSTAQLSLPEAEEAASDAIRSAIEQIDVIQSERELRGLVAVIARRRAITLLRQKIASKRVPREDFAEASGGQDEVDARNPRQEAIEAEMVALLNQALAALPPQNRQLLLEKYVEGYSYEELSARHALPVGTLCPKVMRALAALRQSLDQTSGLRKELKAHLRP